MSSPTRADPPRAPSLASRREALALGFLAAVLAVTVSLRPGMVLAALGIGAGTLLLLLRPRAVFGVLLVLHGTYIWLLAAVFPLLPPGVSVAVGVLKELVLFALVVVVLRYPQRLRVVPARIWILLGAFVGLISLLVLVLAAPVGPALLEARYHLQYLLVLPVAVALGHTAKGRRVIAAVILATGAVVAVVWLSALGWVGIGELSYTTANTRVLAGGASDIGNAVNTLGLHSVLLICLSLGIIRHAPKRRVRMMMWAAVPLFAWVMLSSFSRRSMLGVAVGLLVIIGIGRYWRLLLFGIVVSVVGLSLASQDLLWRLSWSSADDLAGVSTRTLHLQYTLRHLDPLALFVGHGVGTSGVVPMEAGVPGALDLHSYYLVLVFESGFVGLALYLAIWAVALRHLVALYRSSPLEQTDRGLILGTLAAAGAFLFAGLVGTDNATLPVAPVMWALLGISLAAASRTAPGGGRMEFEASPADR